MDINASKSEIIFSVINSYFPDRIASDDHKGIGLENVRQRLHHLYPNHHQLEISNTDEEYHVMLRITL